MKDITERLDSYDPLWENWHRDSFVGEGHFGRVYKYRADFYGSVRYSAVKVVTVDLTRELSPVTDEALNERKNRVSAELKNMDKLRDRPHLVHFLNFSDKDIFDDNGKRVGFDFLIQMEYYDPLTSKLNISPLSAAEVEKVALHIADGLNSMHSINMLHRDVKPDNIYIDSNNEYLLGDFGVAKQSQTSTYATLAGTEPFIAPEIWRSAPNERHYTSASDIYSFGITLYYLLNDNMLPLVREYSTANAVEQAVAARLSGAAFPPPKNGSERLKSIVMKCCQFDPANRFHSMTEVISALKDTSGAPFQNASPYAQNPPPVFSSSPYAGNSPYANGDQFAPDRGAYMNYGTQGFEQQNNGYRYDRGYYGNQGGYAPQQGYGQQGYPQPNYALPRDPAPNTYQQPAYDEPVDMYDDYPSESVAAAKNPNSKILVAIIIGTFSLIIVLLILFFMMFKNSKGDVEDPIEINTITKTSTTTAKTETETEAETKKKTTKASEETTTTTRPEYFVPEEQEYQGYMYVSTDMDYNALNIRKGPSTEYDVLYDDLPAGAQVEKYADVYDEEDDEKWSYITYLDYTGWVMSKFLSTEPTIIQPDYWDAAKEMLVNTKTDPLNIRKGPSQNYDSLYQIPKGATVTMYSQKYIASEKRTFAYINYKDRWGWVNMQYLADPNATTTTKETTTTTKKTTTRKPLPEPEYYGGGLEVDYVDCSSQLENEKVNGKWYSYDPENAVDEEYSTAWVEGASDDGIGEWIEIGFEEEETLTQICICNGLASSETAFYYNNRVKTCLIEFSDGTSFEKKLSGDYADQPVVFDIPDGGVDTEYVRITILSVYKGTKYSDTCISGIEVW